MPLHHSLLFHILHDQTLILLLRQGSVCSKMQMLCRQVQDGKPAKSWLHFALTSDLLPEAQVHDSMKSLQVSVLLLEKHWNINQLLSTPIQMTHSRTNVLGIGVKPLHKLSSKGRLPAVCVVTGCCFSYRLGWCSSCCSCLDSFVCSLTDFNRQLQLKKNSFSELLHTLGFNGTSNCYKTIISHRKTKWSCYRGAERLNRYGIVEHRH